MRRKAHEAVSESCVKTGWGAPECPEELSQVKSSQCRPRPRGRARRVAFTVRRVVCYYEKSSKPRAKEFADAVPLRFTVSDQKRGLPPGVLQSRFLVRRASSKPLRRYAFLGLARELQSRQSMRQTLVEGRSEVANTRVARHWYRIRASRLARLQTRAILSTC